VVRNYLLLLKWANLRYNVILLVVVLIAAIFQKNFWPFVYLLATNLFDVLGYFVVLRRLWGVRSLEVENTVVNINEGDLHSPIILPAYRVIQHMFDYLLFIFIWVVAGFKFALAGAVLKWFALQDLLFYWVVKYPLPETWTWLSWTPLGLFKLIFKKDISLANDEVIYQGAVGVIVAILILVVL